MTYLIEVPSSRQVSRPPPILDYCDIVEPSFDFRAFIARAVRIARTALTVWGGVSIVALAGYSVHAMVAPDARQEVEVAATPAPMSTPAERAAPARETVAQPARPVVIARGEVRPAQPASPPASSGAKVLTIPPEPSAAPDRQGEPVVAARLPRARPDAPVTTGSIERHAARDERRRRILLRYGPPLDYYRQATRALPRYPVPPYVIFER